MKNDSWEAWSKIATNFSNLPVIAALEEETEQRAHAYIKTTSVDVFDVDGNIVDSGLNRIYEESVEKAGQIMHAVL